MIIKELGTFHKNLDKFPLETPPVIIVSGSDTGVVDSILDRIRNRLQQEIGQFETTLFTGELGEDLRLQEEAFSVSLFASYKLLIVKQGEIVFKPVIASSKKLNSFKENFKLLPDRTILLIEYNGPAPAKMTKIFGTRILQFETRILYPNQVQDVILEMSHKMKLNLSADAMHFLVENTEPKAAFIEQKLMTLKEIFSASSDQIIEADQIREVLFPGQGCNSFTLVDALFAHDKKTVKKELIRFNPTSDNFLGILKLILNRTNELRKLHVGRETGMQENELISFLGFKSRHPFVQKKIMSRLKIEINRNPVKQLGKIYDFLIEIENAFKSGVSQKDQGIIFEQRAFQTFFV